MLMKKRLRHAHPFTLLLITILAAPMIAMVPAIALEMKAPSVHHTTPFVSIPVEQPDLLVTARSKAAPAAKPHARPARAVVRPARRLTPQQRLGFAWPVAKAAITSPFGWRPFVAWPGMPPGPHPKKQFHHGDDISCAVGQLVAAAKAGSVIMSGSDADYGNFIVIAHAGGWSTLYAHMEKNLVITGKHVASGGVIGLCGMTGHATGPHVHFEIRHDGSFFDPLKFLR